MDFPYSLITLDSSNLGEFLYNLDWKLHFLKSNPDINLESHAILREIMEYKFQAVPFADQKASLED